MLLTKMFIYDSNDDEHLGGGDNRVASDAVGWYVNPSFFLSCFAC